MSVTFYYCPTCKKEIEDPIRKPMDSMEKVIWVIIILATFGFGLIAFLIYYFIYKKKAYCPVCSSKLALSDQPFEKPEEDREAKTPKEKILKKAGKKLPEEMKKLNHQTKKGSIFCPFCGKEIGKKTAKCPYCGIKLTDRFD